MFKIQEMHPSKSMPVSEYSNSLILDMKSLANVLKPISKNLYENNNRLLNQLLLAKQQEIYSTIISVLVHSLQLAQYKTIITHVLSILNKTIICIKTFKIEEIPKNNREQMSNILSYIINVLVTLSTQYKQMQDTSLRVLQTTFSIIDHALLPLFDFSITTRIFSICLQFCSGVSILQNISVSALFALLETLVQFGEKKVTFEVLVSMLQYLFEEKKFIWLKPKDIRGLIWDLVVVSIKKFNTNHIYQLEHQSACQSLISKMYEIVLQNIFLKRNKNFYNPLPPEKTSGNKNLKQPQSSHSLQSQPSSIVDFIRFFKAYVALSASLSIQSSRIVERQYVSFRSTIPKLGVVCDLERNSRMYIFLEAICQLLLDQYDMPLSIDKGAIFMEILSKISEELCWCNQNGVRVNWENNEYFLDKVLNEQPKISDGDFVRLMKNTLIHLRIKFQKDEDLQKCKISKKGAIDTSRSSSLPQNLGNSKKWETFIKNVVRIIKYLSSLNFITDQTEQDPTRKILLQLQYWFLICPVSKAKNMVLHELLITSNVLNNRMQAIKVSQSVQIGCNILYGYYDDLDSMGLTIILKMMAGIKADWQQGKSFQELDQVYNLVNNIYVEENLIETPEAFVLTVQSLVQCASSLIADISQPKEKPSTGMGSQNSLKRSYKMIQFLLQKLLVVLNHNLLQATKEWNFITGFLITLCINKNPRIKQEGIKCIGLLISKLLKTQINPQLDAKKQVDVMGLYEQLAKSKNQSKQFEFALIDQLKGIMPRIKQQIPIIDGFRIVKILSDNQNKYLDIIGSLHELQQILIKECLFKVNDIKYLKLIVEGMQIKSPGKNEQYRLISLLWAVSDYFKKITPHQNISNQFIDLWDSLFKSIWVICESSKQYETKQSAIHTTTQILGEILSQLPFDFIIVTISKYYQQMILLLIGIHPSSLPDSQKSSETAKVGLKNYIKIFKKLISIQKKSQQDKKQISKNFHCINESITKFLNGHVNEQKTTGNLTLQLLYEILNFISILQTDKGFYEYGVTHDIREMFEAIQSIIKQTEKNMESGVANQKMDLKSHLFKKKLKPLIQKIQQVDDGQKKKQMILNNGGVGNEAVLDSQS